MEIGEAVKRDPVEESSVNKLDRDDATAGSGGCFDCNICLDFAVDPVVTLCGHLYCWPCIYKWLRLDHIPAATPLPPPPPSQCPVCKAALSQSTLVPLYGRGGHSGKDPVATDEIPRRPNVTRPISSSVSPRISQQQQPHHHRRRHQHQHGDDFAAAARVLQPTMLGGTAIAVLPWVFGDQLMGFSYYSRPYHHLLGSGDSPRLRRQEMQAARSLNRISIFLFCCVALCLLLF